MNYSEGWLTNAIKYLEKSVFIYRNGINIALPIENSQRLDRIVRYVTSYVELANEGNTVLFTPYTTKDGKEIYDTLEIIKTITEQKNSDENQGNLIEPIGEDGKEPKIFPSKNIYEALNTLAKEINRGGNKFEIISTMDIFENMNNTISGSNTI